jgi:hypothetical protein
MSLPVRYRYSECKLQRIGRRSSANRLTKAQRPQYDVQPPLEPLPFAGANDYLMPVSVSSSQLLSSTFARWRLQRISSKDTR